MSYAKKLRSLLEEKINDSEDFVVNSSDINNKISKLFWTGAGAMTLIAAVATVVSFIAGLSNIDGWIDREMAAKREARQEAQR